MVELIPVLEIVASAHGVEPPKLYPADQYPLEWAKFYRDSLSQAGYSAEAVPFREGLYFYRPSDLSDQDLLLFLKETVEHKQTEPEDEWISFFGGICLVLNGEAALFPQCCSEICDFVWWLELAQSGKVTYQNGHPAPIVVDDQDHFTFQDPKDGEDFFPRVDFPFQVPKVELSSALPLLVKELKGFSERIDRLSTELPSPTSARLSNILLWRNFEHNIQTFEQLTTMYRSVLTKP